MWSALSKEDEELSLFHWSKFLHCLNICSPQVLDKPTISHFASSNQMILAANSANQRDNKVARSGRKIEPE